MKEAWLSLTETRRGTEKKTERGQGGVTIDPTLDPYKNDPISRRSSRAHTASPGDKFARFSSVFSRLAMVQKDMTH